MLKTDNILNLIESGEIDPYEILELDQPADEKAIRKAYKKKALYVHPDKNGGKKSLEFIILHVSYKYLINTNSSESSYFNILKHKKDYNNTFSESRRESDAQFRDILAGYDASLESNWEDPNVRKQFFADDTQISLDEDLKTQKGKKKYTSYSEVLDDPDVKIKNLIFKNGKFNIDKFNAVFDKLKQVNEESRGLVKYKKIRDLDALSTESSGLGSSVAVFKYNTEDGIAIHNQSKTKRENQDILNLDRVNDYSFKLTPDLVKSVKKKDVTEKRKQRLDKSVVGKKELQQKNEELSEDYSKLPHETEDQFLRRRAKEFEKTEVESRNYIENNIRIFPKALQNVIKQGLEYYNRGNYLEE